MENSSNPNKFIMIFTRIVVCLIVLAIGVAAMMFLASKKTPPKEAEHKERALRVEVVTVQTQNQQVFISGSGEAKAKDVVQLAPEVGGRVVEMHPDLEVGKRISKGDVLFAIDPTNYQAAYDVAAATVAQTQKTIERLQKQQAIDTDRLQTIVRNQDLAKAEYDRIRILFDQNKVGTQSGVDKAESAFNSASDQADQVALAVDLYPIQIQETRSALASARARLSTARADLQRTKVKAPFDSRIVMSSLERGQYVQPGAPVMTLADDSVLEILIPIDSRDARDWLRFGMQPSPQDAAWFSSLEQVTCEVRWTEDRGGHYWEGFLDRIVAFDSKTRTLTVSVKIPAEKALSQDPAQLPLVEGMFCSVKIPGKTMTDVIHVPRWAVSFQNTVYINHTGRLKTVPVKVDRVQGEKAFISEGLKAGDQVIITRLGDPLESSLLDIQNPADGGNAS